MNSRAGGPLQSRVIDTCFTVGVSPTVHFIAEEVLIPYMDEHGIDVQVIYQPDESFHHQTPDWNPYLGNDYVSKVQHLYPERIIGLATLQFYHQPPQGIEQSCVTRNVTLEELDRAIVQLRLGGVRINPIQHNVHVNNRQIVWPILQELVRLQEQIGRRMLVSVHAYGDSLNNSPEALAETARRFPELLFLMQHAGFVWGWGTVNDVAAPVQNVLLDISTMPQKSIVYQTYERSGIQKFCIGTDGPYGTAELKQAIVDDFCRDEREREMILGMNLAHWLSDTWETT